MMDESSYNSSSIFSRLIELEERKQKHNCCLWWFFNSSYNIPVEYDPKHTYCLAFNLCCCPGCLEINCYTKTSHSNENTLLLCCCCTFIL